jgi:hypothetical protein
MTIDPGIQQKAVGAGKLHLNGVRRIRRPPIPIPIPIPIPYRYSIPTCAGGQSSTFSIPHRLPKAQLVGEEKMHPISLRRQKSSVRVRARSLAPLVLSLSLLPATVAIGVF